MLCDRIIDAALVEVSKNGYNSDDLLSSSYRILHTAKVYSEKSIEVIFVPKAMFRQLILAIVLQSGAVVTTTVWRFVYDILSQYFSSRARMTRQLLDRQKEAESLDEWVALANEIDVIQGNDLWRSDPHCALYENDRIEARIDEFVHLMRRSDVFDLMFTLRGGLTRAKFGLLHEGLFSKAMAGTKLLVENYQVRLGRKLKCRIVQTFIIGCVIWCFRQSLALLWILPVTKKPTHGKKKFLQMLV